MKQQLVLFGSAFLITACGGLNYSLSDQATSVFPEEFYYHTIGSCDDGSLGFVSLRVGGIMLWTDPAQVIVGQSDLYLSKDNTFNLRYQEYSMTDLLFDRILSGRADFNSLTGNLTLEGVGTAKSVTLEGRLVLELTFTQAINEPLLVGKKVYFRVVRGDSGLGVTKPDYCHY